MLFGRDMNLKQEVEDSHVTMKDLSKGIAIAQLFVDSLAQHDPYDMEDIFKLKRGEWNGHPLTYLGEIFQNNVHKLLQSYKKSLDSINYDLYSEFETNCMEKRRESSLPKIMSALFTASTSQSQLRFDSRSNGEINTSTQIRRNRPMSPPSPPSPSMHKRDEYFHKNDELLYLHTTENNNNRIIYPAITINDDDDDDDDDDNDDYGYSKIIDNNKRPLSPYENQLSGTLEKRFLCEERRSHSLSSENRFSDNLKGRVVHKELRNRSQSYENRFSDNLKERLRHKKAQNRSQSYGSRLSDNSKEKSELRKAQNYSPPTENQLDISKEKLEFRKSRNLSSPSESRLTDNSKNRFNGNRKPKYRSQRYSRSSSRYQARSRLKTFHQNRSQIQSSNNRSKSRSKSKSRNKSSENQPQRRTRNRSSSKTRKHRKSEDQNMRPRSRKRSRSRVKTTKTSSYKSKKKSKCDDETKKSPQYQNEIHCVNEDQYSSSEPPQHYQSPEVITGVNSNAMIPPQPVYRGPVPYFTPPQYGSSVVFYSQAPPRPPIRIQNVPPRRPPPYFMPHRPHFIGYAPPARHFYGPT